MHHIYVILTAVLAHFLMEQSTESPSLTTFHVNLDKMNE